MAQAPPPGPQPGDPVIFSKFDGMKNTVQSERLGPHDLLTATNVTLDDTGQLSRRRGSTLQVSGNAHSLFTSAQGDITLVVLNGDLVILNKDYSTYDLATEISTDPSQGLPGLAYAQVGRKVYFSSPTDRGVVDLDGQVVGVWGSGEDYWLSPVVNPTATLPAVAGRLLRQPPNATVLCYFNGRIYLAQGKTMWATVLYAYNFVDTTAGYKQFEGVITMIGAVGDGIYVGTDEGLYFLSGSSYDTLKKVRVMDSGVIPGSMVTIPSELGNPPQESLGADTPLQVSIAFMTTNGFCAAQDGGQVYNLTETKFFFPQASSAASMYRRQDGMNQFVTTMQSGGDPTNNAAIGDFIEGTIIRASALTN